MGIASSVLALVRNIAGAFGIALFGTILTNATENNAFNIAHNSILRSTNPAVISQFISLVTLKAQVLAYSTVFQIASIVVLVGAGLALFIKVEVKKQGNEVIFID